MGTSKLQEETARMLYREFGSTTIKENHRPRWLTNSDGNRIELDFYLPELKIAIEVNGNQHYTFTPFFHGDYAGFEKQRDHDEIKQITCTKRGIELIEISSEFELKTTVEYIRNKCGMQIPFDEYFRLKTLYINKRLYSIKKGLKNYKRSLEKAQTKKERAAIKKHIKGHVRALEEALTKAEIDFISAIEQLR